MQLLGHLRFPKSLWYRARYYTRAPPPILFPPAEFSLRYKQAMVDVPKTGEPGVLPNLNQLPPSKRPRLMAKNENKRAQKRRKKQINLPELGSSEDVLWRDVIAVLGKDVVDKAIEEGTEFDSPFEFHQEVELDILSVCSNGEAIALSKETKNPWTVVLPFALPGEKVRARIYRNARLHSFADLLEVITPNHELRDSSRIKCQYFGSCAGCQYQMLSYETQLDLKRDVVVKAYKNFSNLPETAVPPILPTIGSPLQYEYRTKLTPHFEAPPKAARKNRTTNTEGKPDWLQIGFNRIGTSKTMDIEDCPIATPIINEAYRPVRENIIKNIFTYKKGVSLLFRDSLDTSYAGSQENGDDTDNLTDALNKNVCVTDHRATVREKVGDWIFEYAAGSFFQNNNSVLVPLTDYVRNALFPPSPISTDPASTLPTHLVDAYCGAGLFAITLSSKFTAVAGIELSADSIKAATRNAKLNNIPDSKITFRAGNAADIFATVEEFPPERTALVIDPPRKGCDDNFIQQLLAFRCKTVVYVSCNVHTQARDVGVILKATENEETGRKYVLESIRGFDLFPQTAHVESVAVLRLV